MSYVHESLKRLSRQVSRLLNEYVIRHKGSPNLMYRGLNLIRALPILSTGRNFCNV